MVKMKIGQKFRAFCLLVVFSIPLSGIAVLAYQSFVWLKQGYWRTLESRLVLDKVLPTNFLQWLHNPYSWSGLNKIISPVFNSSLAMFLLVFGLVVLLLVAKAFDLFLKPAKEEQARVKRWRTL
ncbi:MAG TPA: hypothetical protein VMW72_18635 [Sedimentisphaerales bacterium]|nr:hypothetical protein [Sedimentisphaerales bacterium]